MSEYLRTIAELRNGKLLADLDERLPELVGECVATGKIGALTLQLKVRPHKGGKAVAIEAIIKEKTPEFDPPVDDFLIGSGNSLMSHPSPQTEMGVEVDPATGEIMSASPKPA